MSSLKGVRTLRYQIHIKPSEFAPHTVGALMRAIDVLRYLRQKNIKAELFSNKPVIRCELKNPGLITHIKKQFGDKIVGIFSDAHGAGLYKRPTHHVTSEVKLEAKRYTRSALRQAVLQNPGASGAANDHLFGPAAVPLTPIQVAKAYNFPTPGPSLKDKVVAIIELGGGYDPSKVYDYCRSLGVKTPQLFGHNVDTGSNDPGGDTDADGEVCLDVDIVAAVAPGVKILVMFAPNTTNGFIDAIYACSNYFLKPDVVSISWGAPENSWDSAAVEAMNNAIQACVNAGINVFVAAGDDGSSDGEVGNNVDFPSSSPHSISCGGTKLILNADGTRHSEVVWNELLLGEGATGGGKSTIFPGRTVPDIAGNADPNSGYTISVNGDDQAIGGTSAVAPLMAALNVILNSNLQDPATNFLSTISANPDVCFDVVSGNNGAFGATKGKDDCSGYGVPDGTKLLAKLKSSLVSRVFNFLKKPVRDFL